MQKLYRIVKTAALALSLGCFNFAAAQSEDPPERPFDNIPAKWDYYYLDGETIEAHMGEEVSRFCVDDDFMAAPHAYRTMKERERARGSRPRLPNTGGLSLSGSRLDNGIPEFRRFRFLQGGVDFSIVGQNALIVTLPEAGDHLIETQGCKKNLRRAKYIKFTDEIDRRKVNRCLFKGGSVVIQTRKHTSGIKACRIKGIYAWDGPTIPEDLQIEFEEEPIVLE